METIGKSDLDELLSRGVAEVIDHDHLRARLSGEKKLRIKLGIDPTSPNLHLGRAVALLKLRDFQKLGHTIVFIVGDFTGVIGDTSDKESERPMLSRDTVEKNMENYVKQASMILDIDAAEIHYNSTWLEKLGYDDIGSQADQFSLAEFIARDNIRRRLDAGKRVSLREVLYPLMQGFDSVAVNADVEIGGTDQRFNLLAGRRLQEAQGEAPQDIVMMNLLPGTDGRKMSSSWGNTINLTDTPQDMFGKVMSIPDDLIVMYFTHCTRVALSEVESIGQGMHEGTVNPRDAKLRLAREIVSLFHGREEGAAAERFFVETFSEKKIPTDVPEHRGVEGMTFLEYLVSTALVPSKSEARRLIEQGGVEIAGERVLSHDGVLTSSHQGAVVRIGKKGFVRVVF